MSHILHERQIMIAVCTAMCENWKNWTKHIHADERDWPYYWSPLRDDMHAFQLQVDANLTVEVSTTNEYVVVCRKGLPLSLCYEMFAHHQNKFSAARLAICRSVAALGDYGWRKDKS